MIMLKPTQRVRSENYKNSAAIRNTLYFKSVLFVEFRQEKNGFGLLSLFKRIFHLTSMMIRIPLSVSRECYS